MPEDDGEFYQFCYVGDGQVRGASVPFQFKSPRGEDFVEVEGDEDLMIVRTKTAVLQVRQFRIPNFSIMLEPEIETQVNFSPGKPRNRREKREKPGE